MSAIDPKREIVKVFLSYSHNEKSFAANLSRELSSHGISVWRDVERLDLGELMLTAISTALSECDACCVVISRESMSSKWVNAELSAAFMRWTQEPSFKIIPLVIEQDAVPELLKGMCYLNTRSLSVTEISNRVLGELSAFNRALWNGIPEWDSLLSAIERDQFSDAGSPQYGGWSKAYSTSYLPLAFPDQVPDSVATVDSITVTYWMIRGLCTLKKLLTQNSEQESLLHRIELAIQRGRFYLTQHFNGQSAGLIRPGADGKKIHADVRHSVGFAKAMLLLGSASEEGIRNALQFAVVNRALADDRLPTLAEVYHSVRLLHSNPNLRSRSINDSMLNERATEIEQKLLQSFKTFKDITGSSGLFGHSNQMHMSPYYTWWVMDSCGQQMFESDNPNIRELARDALKGLHGVKVWNYDGSAGFPITIGGHCDIGASALIGELLIRFFPKEYSEDAHAIASFLRRRISEGSLSKYAHQELLWAVPPFFDRYKTLGQRK